MKMSLTRCMLSVLLLIGIAGCATPAKRVESVPQQIPESVDTRRTDMHGLQYLWSALEREGLRVTEATTTADSGVFGEDARSYVLSADEAFVRVYVPDASHETSDLASRVSTDGSSYEPSAGQTVYVSWAGRPIFFRDSNAVVFYLMGETSVGKAQSQVSPETDRKVVRALTKLMGAPFAGAP